MGFYQSALKSTTSMPSTLRRVVGVGTGFVLRWTGAAASPSNIARSASSAPGRSDSQAATAGQRSSPISCEISAARRLGSLSRAQDTAAQPSDVGSSRVFPPTEILPFRVIPVNAARSERKRAPRTGVPMNEPRPSAIVAALPGESGAGRPTVRLEGQYRCSASPGFGQPRRRCPAR